MSAHDVPSFYVDHRGELDDTDDDATPLTALDAAIAVRNVAGEKLQGIRQAYKRTQYDEQSAGDELSAIEAEHTERAVQAAIDQTAAPDATRVIAARQKHWTLQQVEAELEKREAAAFADVEAADKAHDRALRDLARAMLPAARAEVEAAAQAFATAQAKWLSIGERAEVATSGIHADAGGLQDKLHAAFIWPEPSFPRDGAPRPMTERDLRALAAKK